MNNETIPLGLGNPPDRRYLYVSQDDSNSGACWYEFNVEANRKTDVVERALTGYITGLRLKSVTGKFGTKLKFDILMRADRLYAIRSGAETTFTKGIVQALIALETGDRTTLDPSRPLTIVVSPSTANSKIVFGAVYTADGTRVKFEWDKDIEVVPLIEHLQTIFGNGGQGDDDHQDEDEEPRARDERTQPHSNGQSHANGMASEAQIKELIRAGGVAGYVDHELDKHCAGFYNGRGIRQLSSIEAIEYRRTLMS